MVHSSNLKTCDLRLPQGHDDLIVLFNQFLPEGHDMRVVLENAKQRPLFSQGMDVLVLALSSTGVLDYLPGVVHGLAQESVA